MNCGLGNLDSLKKHLLPQTLQGDTTFDQVIADIGLGVAGLMDTHCNRKFAYLEQAQQVFTGDRDHYYLERFPVVIISQVQLRYFRADNWTNISGQPLAENDESGLLHFGYTLGILPIQVQSHGRAVIGSRRSSRRMRAFPARSRRRFKMRKPTIPARCRPAATCCPPSCASPGCSKAARSGTRWTSSAPVSWINPTHKRSLAGFRSFLK